jgi:hypothetical protein
VTLYDQGLADAIPCRCGHSPTDHHRSWGACFYSTPEVTWACDCMEYKPERWYHRLARRLKP